MRSRNRNRFYSSIASHPRSLKKIMTSGRDAKCTINRRLDLTYYRVEVAELGNKASILGRSCVFKKVNFKF